MPTGFDHDFTTQRAPVTALQDMVGGSGTPPVDTRLDALRVAITGQQTPPPATGWRMSNNTSATRLDALEPLVAQLQATVTTLSTTLAATFADLGPRLALAEARVTTSLANDAANAAAAVAAQAKADAADARALAADAKAVAAQTKADADAVTAAAAQATATAAQATATAAQTLAAQALAAAQAAQASEVALAARFRNPRVAVPAIAIGASQDVVVTWSPAFADANYTAIADPAGLVLLGLDATELASARTASSATFRIKNVLGLAVASGGTLSILAMHD